MNENNCIEVDNFKPVFKYFKQKANCPSFKDVIDFHVIRDNVKVNKFPLNESYEHLGLKSCGSLDVLQVPSIPGLAFICNPFSESGKLLWSKRCLEKYPRKPSKTNIDEDVDCDRVWDNFKESVLNQPKKQLATNKAQLSSLKSLPIWKLRWATLGYHHNWNTKEYCDDNASKFPSELNALSKLFAATVGHSDYIAQAAIVNFYHVGSTLSAHTDHSEHNLKAPLISISLGLDAVFLIGGATKEQKPTAILIRSGDVIIMSRESRLSYHAVPRIVECETDAPRDDPAQLFLAHSRININVRQVLT